MTKNHNHKSQSTSVLTLQFVNSMGTIIYSCLVFPSSLILDYRHWIIQNISILGIWEFQVCIPPQSKALIFFSVRMAQHVIGIYSEDIPYWYRFRQFPFHLHNLKHPVIEYSAMNECPDVRIDNAWHRSQCMCVSVHVYVNMFHCLYSICLAAQKKIIHVNTSARATMMSRTLCRHF